MNSAVLRSLNVWKRFEKSLAYVAGTHSVNDAWEMSLERLQRKGQADFCIRDGDTVLEAVQKLARTNTGCLITTSKKGRISGVISERDVLRKVALMKRDVSKVKVNEIFTFANKISVARPRDSVQTCLENMHEAGVRHLPVVDDAADLIGIISMEDCLRVVMDDKVTQQRITEGKIQQGERDDDDEVQQAVA